MLNTMEGLLSAHVVQCGVFTIVSDDDEGNREERHCGLLHNSFGVCRLVCGTLLDSTMARMASGAARGLCPPYRLNHPQPSPLAGRPLF